MSGMIVLFLAPLRLGLILGTSFGGGSLKLVPDIQSIPLNISPTYPVRLRRARHVFQKKMAVVRRHVFRFRNIICRVEVIHTFGAVE